MKDFYDLFNNFLSLLKIPATGWTFALFVVLFFLRDRIVKAANSLLDLLGQKFASEAGSRRFEPKYKEFVRAAHLHLKIVGIRTEEERRPKISDAYVPIKLLQRGGSIEQTVSVDQVVRDNAYNLILGDPGAGKSTLLDYLTVEYTNVPATGKSRFGSVSKLIPLRRKARTLCPIYIPLRRCKATNKTLLADILDEETGILPEPVQQKMPKKFIEHCVERNRALLLLDGLDEVADEEMYHSVVRKVNAFIQLYPSNKVVVTCRKAGWRGGLNPDFQVYSALQLDAPQQHEFVHKWYATMLQYISHGVSVQESSLQRRAEREANHLLTLIQVKERLGELASNPLMLSLICLVHKQRKDLPRGRTALYQDCLDILLELWDRTDKEFDQTYPTTDQKKLLLRRIAYRMHESGAREEDRHQLEKWVLELLPGVTDEAAAADIVRQIEVRSGLMVERSINKLTFSHLTFQEFLVVDYFRSEQNELMPLDTITDWSAWREPVLLMSGLKNKPTPFIEDLYVRQPLLALYGLAEADPTKLDMHIAQRIVDDMIDQVQKGTIPINEALPALVGLLSIEGNPFGESAIKIIYTRIHECSREETSNLVEALIRTPTRESARILLSLLTKFQLSIVEDILISGLARIGDAAVYEALESRERDELTEARLFALLLACYTPLTTRTLWTRYELHPPQGSELAWAKSWALRLADPQQDEQLQPFTTSGPGVSDAAIWPYRQNDRSAVAAIVKAVFPLLLHEYEDPEKVKSDIGLIPKFSLRLLVPLLVANPELASMLNDSLEETVGRNSRTGPLRNSLEDYQKRFRYASSPHAWRTLGNFLKRRKESTFWRRIVQVLGIAIEVVSLVLVETGIVTLLPPNGNPLTFWAWLPLWVKFLLSVGVPVGIAILWLYLYIEENVTPLDFDWEDLGTSALVTFVSALSVVAPCSWLYVPLIVDEHETIETLVSQGRMTQSSVRCLIFCFCIGVATTIAGFLVIRHWLANVISPYLGVPFLTAFVLWGIFLAERAGAFENNRLATWLAQHPRGDEVLDEFK